MPADESPAVLPGEQRDERDEPMPPFLKHGFLAVVVYAVAMSAVIALSDGDVQGMPLVAFSVGFTIFMGFYFFSMYVAWLFLD